MAYEAEIELLRKFGDDLQRVHAWGVTSPKDDAEKAMRDGLLESLHRRTPAMRRAVKRSGVNHTVSAIGGNLGRHRVGSVDVLEEWHGFYVQPHTLATLQRAIGAFESGALPEVPRGSVKTGPSSFDRVRHILERLPRAARSLRDRYDKRDTLKMDDEYDVQDLLRTLLVIDFDDVRKEEWTPSYAGKSARMDLLLKAEQIVIEAKITKAGRTEKQVGDELIVDIERYQAHPDCKSLVCFVFDPTFQIGNPAALERDLARTAPIRVEVIVAPKH